MLDQARSILVVAEDTSSMQTLLLASFSLVAIYLLRLYIEFSKAVRHIGNHPGFRILLNPVSGGALSVVPRIRGISTGSHNGFNERYAVFKEIGYDIYSAISVLPKPVTALFIADAEAIKEILSSRTRFIKPVEVYEKISFYGRNIVSSEGEEWKKYKKISAPAFSERNNALVWNETMTVITSLFEDVWGNESEVVVDQFLDITKSITLFIISIAGFGQRISWQDDDNIPPNHQMTFQTALQTVSSNVVTKIMTPEWAYGLTKGLRTIRAAFRELEQYMVEMIESQRGSEKRQEGHDIFSNLMRANESVDYQGDAKLTDRELIGNIFIFFLAGQETTAHTLCFALALLALHQEEQETLYKHITNVLPKGRLPTYRNVPMLTYVNAVLYETLRMFPPVSILVKECTEDTVIVTTNNVGQKTQIPAPKGASLSVHITGLHHNPRYWEDPDSFKPARFLGAWPRDAFLPFNGGPRACLGRKFAETESIAVLTMLVLHYKVEIKPEPQFASETFEQRKARVLAAQNVITVTPDRVPLVFKRRV